MASSAGTWVRELRPARDLLVKPVCSTAVVGAAIEYLGADAVAWAVQAGHHIAVQSAEMFPVFGTSPAQLATVRLGTESAAINALRVIAGDEFGTPAVMPEALQAIQDYVHRGIPLPVILQAVRAGHAWLASACMRACVDVVPVAEQPPQLLHAAESLFGYFHTFTDDISTEYAVEHERWLMTALAAREEIVEAVLNGDMSDYSEAEQALRYWLAHRYHLGVVVWMERPRVADGSALQRLAIELLRTAGADQTLVITRGMSTVHAWGNGMRRLTPNDLGAVLADHEGIRCSVGCSRHGLEGFVASHRDAVATRAVAEAFPELTDAVLVSHDVRLLSLLARDMPAVRQFVTEELRGLGADEPHIADLRKTAEAYLRLKHSPLAVANEMHIVRNTVSYRLKKAEDLLGHSLDECTLETWVALILSDAIGSRQATQRSLA